MMPVARSSSPSRCRCSGCSALLLAFTFGMAADRYAERQRLVTDEANLLHSLLLRSSLLPEPARARFQQLLGQFVDARLAFFDARQNLVAVEEAIDRTEKLHDQMWGLVRTEALRDPPMQGAEGMLRSLNDEWSPPSPAGACLRKPGA